MAVVMDGRRVFTVEPVEPFMWAFASQNLFSRPARSLLAMLGLTVAISGMVGLFSVTAGMQATVDKTFNRVQGIVAMQPGTAIPLFSKLPLGWADEIAGLRGVRQIAREVWARANLVEGKSTFYPPRFLYGTDVNNVVTLKAAVYRDDVTAGRFLTPEDDGQLKCVISQQLADEYHKEVGSTLRVDGSDLEVIGIYDANSLLLNMSIVTSGTTARQISRFEDDLVSAIYIEPDGTLTQEQLINEVREHFRGRPLAKAADPLGSLGQLSLGLLGLPNPAGPARTTNESAPAKTADSTAASTAETPGKPADAEPVIEVHSTVEWGRRIQEFGGEMDIFLILMNTIGVLIALFSIINTMLMSVTERLTEFGVLRANGWSRRNVIHLILAESALLGVIGGVCGCIVGYIGTQVINVQFADRLNLYASPLVLGASLGFSLLIGTIGGLYPAWWSVRQSPMAAIRRG
jgi:putative ABC transport system permease protein